jgi:hypothetical protein
MDNPMMAGLARNQKEFDERMAHGPRQCDPR